MTAAATEQIFANNFWGLKDDGYHVLTAKMSHNKKTFEDIKSFYSIRASLHEEFGRKLMKHAKSGVGREEIGTLQNLLKSAHEEMERTAQTHIDLSQKLKMTLEVELNNFILDQKDKKKLTSINTDKAYRFKNSSDHYLLKVKEKYESEYAKLATLQTQVGNLSGREAEKLKQKIERAHNEARIQEQEYKNACRKSADATAVWNKTWKTACDTYQIMEKQRLEFIHHSFSMYINMLSSASSQDTESFERFWKALDDCDTAKDIQRFIQLKSTGPKIPEAKIFVDYMDDPAKTFQQHTIANFPTPPELQMTEPLLPELDIAATSDEPVSDPVTPTEVERKPLPPPKRNNMSVPDSPSTTDISNNDEEEETATTSPSDEEDVTIDPRAKVMFAIGNNMFDLGHLEARDDLTRRSSTLKPRHSTTSTVRRMNSSSGSRRRRPSTELEAVVNNFSYQSLFEELGVYDEKIITKDNKKPSSTTTGVISDMSGAELRRRVTKKQNPQQQVIHQPQPQQQVIHQPPVVIQQQQEAPVPVEAYAQPRQQPHHYLPQQQSTTYYPQQPSYANQTPMHASVSYQPNSTYQHTQIVNSNAPVILYWVVAIADWYSGKPEELQYARGTVFGVTEARPNGWYYAIKFDSRMNSLSNEKGYIAQNMVQLYRILH